MDYRIGAFLVPTISFINMESFKAFFKVEEMVSVGCLPCFSLVWNSPQWQTTLCGLLCHFRSCHHSPWQEMCDCCCGLRSSLWWHLNTDLTCLKPGTDTCACVCIHTVCLSLWKPVRLSAWRGMTFVSLRRLILKIVSSGDPTDLHLHIWTVSKLLSGPWWWPESTNCLL